MEAMSCVSVRMPYLLAAAVTPAPAAGPAPVVPADTAQITRSPDLSKIFEKRPKTPMDPKLVSVWHFDGGDHHSIEEVFHTPDGRTFVTASSFDTSRDRRKDANGYTQAFDDHGRPLWKYESPPGWKIESHLFTSDATYVLTQGEDSWDGSRIVALNRHGDEVWKHETDSRVRIDSIRRGPDGTVYAKAGDDVTALGPDGKVKWTKHLDIHSDEFFHVGAPDGTQIFANDNFSNNFGYDSFRAMDAKGRRHELDWPDIGTFPLEVGSRVVYGGEKGEVHGIDLAGGKSWEVQTDSVRGLKMPFLGRDGNVYVEGRFDNKLYAISPDGRMLWQRTVEDFAPGGFDTPFQVDTDGSVWYQHEDGDRLQQIAPDGKPGRSVRVDDGIASFMPGGDGKLYVWTSESKIRVHDLAKDQGWDLPLTLEHPHTWDIKEVRPGGIVALQCMTERWDVQPSQDRELKEALEEVLAGRQDQTAPTIEKGDDWVVIGNVRVPVRR